MQKYTNQALRLDADHGYRLDGDNVELNAQVLLSEGATLANWKLQLWANDVLASGVPSGIKVAEVDLELAKVNAGVAHLATRVEALLPPTGRYYDMALVLARSDAERPADIANYAQRQWIAGPFLHGAVGYSVATRADATRVNGPSGGQVTVTVEQVCNPRSDGNLSGTLALELWAVAEPYVGGVVRGHQLAGVVLGTLDGQTSRSEVAATVDFIEPPAGQWQVVLMLREWTAAGYVTRDYRTFDATYGVAPVAAPASSVARAVVVAPVATKPAPAVVKPEPVVSAPERPVVVAPVATKPALAAVSTQPSVSAPERAVAAAPVASTAARAAAAVEALEVVEATLQPTARAPGVSPSQTTASGSISGAAIDARVSVQTASVDELTRVKGITKKVAQEIVRARPFKSLDELTRVKGIGDKSLRAIRGAIKL